MNAEPIVHHHGFDKWNFHLSMNHMLRIYSGYFPHHMEFYLCDGQFFDKNPFRTEREIRERCRLVRTYDRNMLVRLFSEEVGYESFYFEVTDLFPRLNVYSTAPSPELTAAVSQPYRIVAVFRKNPNQVHVQFSPEIIVRVDKKGVIRFAPSGTLDQDIASIVKRLHAFQSPGQDQHRLSYEIWGTEDIETLKLFLPVADISKSAVWTACQRNDPAILRLLLEGGADPNSKHMHENEAAMSYCSEKGYVNLMEILYEFGADVNQASQSGWLRRRTNKSPLQTAVSYNQQAAVHFLINRGADVNYHDHNDWTPLLNAIAAPDANEYTVRMLIAAGAQVNAATEQFNTTPLISAASRGLVDIVRLLLNNSALVDAQNIEGTSALYLASEMGHFATVTALLDHGADPNLPADNGYTPQMIAAKNKHWQVVEALRGTNGAVDSHEQSEMDGALIEAARLNNTEVVQMLLDRGADAFHADTNGETALVYAAKNANWPMAHSLLIHGAAIGHLNADGESAAEVAKKLYGTQSDIYRLFHAYEKL